ITIEDSAELCLKNIKNLVRLETRNKNSEGNAAITIRDLIKSALRMRPDRIIVGEVRSGEALDMISAMNSGHDGSLSTGHANSCKDMLKRLETMILMAVDMPVAAIRGQIAAGIDLMVHLGRSRDGKRKLLEIQELADYKDGEIILNPIYRYVRNDGGDSWEKIGEIKNCEKLQRV
ncbi:MAG: CpaF/VirB11 family protein, partial [Eubacterium sp.]|nr:CpaF/VirB11 family protein [Eubacterium sp.]